MLGLLDQLFDNTCDIVGNLSTMVVDAGSAAIDLACDTVDTAFDAGCEIGVMTTEVVSDVSGFLIDTACDGVDAVVDTGCEVVGTAADLTCTVANVVVDTACDGLDAIIDNPGKSLIIISAATASGVIAYKFSPKIGWKLSKLGFGCKGAKLKGGAARNAGEAWAGGGSLKNGGSGKKGGKIVITSLGAITGGGAAYFTVKKSKQE